MNSLKEHLAGGAANSRGAIDHGVSHRNIAIDNGKGVDIRQVRDHDGGFEIRGGNSVIVNDNIAFRALQDNLWMLASL